MKISNWAGVLLVCASLGASEVTDLRSSAEQLDRLVSQTKRVQETVKPGFQPERREVPPVSLSRIAPVVARRLKVPENQVVRLLRNDRQKLSNVVLARLLERSTSTNWQDLLTRHQADELIQLAEERELAATARKTMDELYTELAFAALDGFEKGKDSAVGSSPESSSKSKSSAK